MNDTITKPFLSIPQKIHELSAGKGSLLIAIDGRCSSGKTTLASYLKEDLGCNVIPMDHFFLQPHMRTKERMSQPGGNVDYERFLAEVLLPLTKGKSFSYRPYNCHIQQLGNAVSVNPSPITIVEGSYSCHPQLRAYYDYCIFLTTSYENQLERIAARNGSQSLTAFKERWIPLEELYFEKMDIANQCDICLTT